MLPAAQRAAAHGGAGHQPALAPPAPAWPSAPSASRARARTRRRAQPVRATATPPAQPAPQADAHHHPHGPSEPSSAAWLQRTELLVGAEGLARLRGARVLVVGLGGVGSWAAELLAR